uniref:Uncharacterized protein n=1 Tax=Nelumbo nucifera TaxID=4432 RepID=A0A822Z7L2_NELNU|nr:TPA_asm: hypothetical protein HUJ06_008129 [Nelumbo nucifera]
MVEEMTIPRFKPSAFEFRSLVTGYGRLGFKPSDFSSEG